ncbi:unnamed protein product, partial [Ectocarpus sp. 13 AM-2016]
MWPPCLSKGVTGGRRWLSPGCSSAVQSLAHILHLRARSIVGDGRGGSSVD